MAKFYGVVGYSDTVESAPDVYTDDIVRRPYYGDIIQNNRKWERSESVNDNTNVSNRISIIADQYAFKSFHLIKYVEWMGAKWKVVNIDVQPPRLILSIGGVFNDNET